MEEKVYTVEEYNRLLELQRQYEDDIITEDDLSLEEMDELHQLYLTQIRDLRKKLAKKIEEGKEDWLGESIKYLE